MIQIDGSEGEGGGQVLRTSLALSVVTGKPFRLFKIRAGRPKPGLKKQHLACVRAAAQISNADVTGDANDSTELTFAPQGIFPGKYRFSVGSAGSAGLVLQTVLPPLLCAAEPSFVAIEGGTHNAWAPPFDFLEHSFLPQLAAMGARVSLTAERLGFYPAGGGLVHANIQPWTERRPLKLLAAGPTRISATAYVSKLPEDVAERELRKVRQAFPQAELNTANVQSIGPGNALCLFAQAQGYTEVVTAFGKRGTRAEEVAKEAVTEMQCFLKSGAPVGEHLADQLLLPMALGAGGRFRTLEPSGHTRTNIETMRRFLDVEISVEPTEGAFEIRAEGTA